MQDYPYPKPKNLSTKPKNSNQGNDNTWTFRIEVQKPNGTLLAVTRHLSSVEVERYKPSPQEVSRVALQFLTLDILDKLREDSENE